MNLAGKGRHFQRLPFVFPLQSSKLAGQGTSVDDLWTANYVHSKYSHRGCGNDHWMTQTVSQTGARLHHCLEPISNSRDTWLQVPCRLSKLFWPAGPWVLKIPEYFFTQERSCRFLWGGSGRMNYEGAVRYWWPIFSQQSMDFRCKNPFKNKDGANGDNYSLGLLSSTSWPPTLDVLDCIDFGCASPFFPVNTVF